MSDTKAAIANQQTLKIGDATRLPSGFTPEVVDMPSIQEIVVDGIASVGLTPPILRISLFADRPPVGTDPFKRVIVGRIAMTPQSAYLIATTLQKVLDQLVETGSISPLTPINVS